MPSSGFHGGKYTTTLPFVLRKFLGVKATVTVTPESPTRSEDGVIEAAVSTSGWRFAKMAVVKVALVVPPEFAKLTAMFDIGVSELGFLKVNTRKVHLLSEVVVDICMEAMFAAMLQLDIEMPVVAETQLVSVVLGVNEPGVGTLNTMVSPEAKNPVDDVSETTKVIVAGEEPTV